MLSVLDLPMNAELGSACVATAATPVIRTELIVAWTANVDVAMVKAVIGMSAASMRSASMTSGTHSEDDSFVLGFSIAYFFMSLRKYFRSISASRAAWLIL